MKSIKQKERKILFEEKFNKKIRKIHTKQHFFFARNQILAKYEK